MFHYALNTLKKHNQWIMSKYNTTFFYTHLHGVVSKDSGHAAGAVADTESAAVVSVGAAGARVELGMVIYEGTGVGKSRQSMISKLYKT